MGTLRSPVLFDTVETLHPGAIPDRPPAPADLAELLSASRLLTEEALSRAYMVAQESGEPVEAVVTRLGLISEQDLAGAIADATGIPLVGSELFPAQAIPGPELSPAFLKDAHALPIALDDEAVTIALVNPFNEFIEQAFSFTFGRKVIRVLARASDIDGAIERLYAQENGEEPLAAGVDDDDLERLKDLVSDAPVIRAVNRLISRAVDESASDIHIEPTEDGLTVRFRVDGMLRAIPSLPAAMRSPLVSRIKVMADLDIAERRIPQDGRLRMAVRGRDIDLRVATAPSVHGESVVMRILDRSNLALNFDALGFEPKLQKDFTATIAQPHGIVLVTGPTGSGKTTTLYAALSSLNAPARKLLTVEDPIEYRLPGVIQAQVNPTIEFSFSSALRSFLRQDPDVIMVGEIRDQETAQVAVQAALTGHMILSTLHTNTAAGAVTRLMDMGVEPFLLSSVLRGVLAQRLVRKLCSACRKSYAPTPALAKSLGATLSQRLPATLYHAVGCGDCGNSGYAGRLAIFEFLRVEDAIAALILHNASGREIAAQAQSLDMHGLMDDGLEKAGRGLTTIEEVLRVTGGD